METNAWYRVLDHEEIISPALLVFPDRIQKNIDTMIAMSGGTEHLRPHIKTHKTAEITKMQQDAGIYKFKCATIAEAELLALGNVPDILLAMQVVGANLDRFALLMETYPHSRFSALVDNKKSLDAYTECSKKMEKKVSLWMDLNIGMNRTGIIPNDAALALYRSMVSQPEIEAMGLHVYDGHLRNPDANQRKNSCDTIFTSVLAFKKEIEASGSSDVKTIAGGSPTFPFHAGRSEVDVSPGTTLLWDAGYGTLFPEMPFLPAAVLLTRIISKPEKNILCLDLGHKSIAPEMAFPRVQFLGVDGLKQIGQSEEHFVLESENSDRFEVGDILYAIPMHICPTVAKYDYLEVVKHGRVVDRWAVAARNQRITI